MIITILLSFILVLLIYNYYLNRGRNDRLINLIPGLPCYPIIGNVLSYFPDCFSQEKMWKRITTDLNQYYPICKYRVFSWSIVTIRHPDDLQIILSSTKHIEKSSLYNVFNCWLGTGLFTSKGSKWHSRRKLLNSTFHFDILKPFVEILFKEGENMTKSLKNEGNTVVKDLIPFFSKHTVIALCETVMGTSLQGFGTLLQQYTEAVHQMTAIIIDNAKVEIIGLKWLWPLISKYKKQKKILKILHKFTERIIAERKLYHEQTNGRYLQNFDNEALAVSDDTSIESRRKRRKRLTVLDFLIAESRDGLITDLDIREEIDTFLFGGHDTIATNLSYTLVLLAEHKDIQDRVRNEINTALQENGEKFTIKLLQDLLYLERCIKESMRLYPSVHSVLRMLEEDVKLQSYLVPAGTNLYLNIYGVHRDPNFWENPEVFDPDRFLPEKSRNRHPYSYIPFSAGPRNCIGQRFAMLEMKAMIAPLIYNFYLEPIDDLKTLRILHDVILRPALPLRIKFIRIYERNANI